MRSRRCAGWCARAEPRRRGDARDGARDHRTHAALDEYFDHLERAHGFARSWIRTDYAFADVDMAARVCGGFFGPALVERIRAERWARVPECTAIFVASRA